MSVASRTPPVGRSLARARGGFTLIEALVATALLGFSLIVMFGFHSQAVRSNMHARKMTACTYLAQLQMERLLSEPWTVSSRPADLVDSLPDMTPSNSWAFLEHPSSGAQPTAVNGANETTATLGQPVYYVTWDVQDVDATGERTRLRVRCQYYDKSFAQWRGTTIASYRYVDGT